jgi:opacity protein-like surface antigen
MKSRLFLATTLCALAATTQAADGYDKTGSAAFTARAHTSTAAGTYAADSVDETLTVAAANGVDKITTGKAID